MINSVGVYIPALPFWGSATLWYSSSITIWKNLFHERDIVVVDLFILCKLSFQPIHPMHGLISVIRHPDVFIPKRKWQLVMSVHKCAFRLHLLYRNILSSWGWAYSLSRGLVSVITSLTLFSIVTPGMYAGISSAIR